MIARWIDHWLTWLEQFRMLVTPMPPRDLGEQCPRCFQYRVYGKLGERACTNCGAFEKVI